MVHVCVCIGRLCCLHCEVKDLFLKGSTVLAKIDRNVNTGILTGCSNVYLKQYGRLRYCFTSFIVVYVDRHSMHVSVTSWLAVLLLCNINNCVFHHHPCSIFHEQQIGAFCRILVAPL